MLTEGAAVPKFLRSEMGLISCALLLLVVCEFAHGFLPAKCGASLQASGSVFKSSSLTMSLTLHGSQQTRSPLVSWYLLEKSIPFSMADPRPSNHPFGQVPFLSDQGGVEVFESGAILLYLADEYTPGQTAKERASYTKWVVWANSELDGLCFGKGMSGTQLDKPNKALDRLEQILGQCDWLVDNTFSVADCAVGSYLNYVPVFFRGAKPSVRPNIAKYMRRCAERPAFAEAFGKDHADAVRRACP